MGSPCTRKAERIELMVRVRFAPSPTGHLHIGGMRSAIFNWLFARHNHGTFLLRIEDTDVERSKKEYTDSILASFAWMKVDWDEPVVIQSERIARHQEVAQMLLKKGAAYYCQCTPEQVAERLAKQTGFDINFIKYDGKCRDARHTHGALRFKLPHATHEITWDDLIRGQISINTDQIDDFIIVRSDGTPMYNFVVVVDDADMKISYVIRGEEHIANTPKQIVLYQACNFTIPQFAHLPMILGPDGSKLSKRDAATGVFEYKEQGYLPDALFNYLVRLGWAHGDQEVFTRKEMIDLFTLDHVGKKGAIFDQTKLDWLNGLYIRNTADQELLDIILKDLSPTFLTDLPQWHTDSILLLINMYKQRAKTLRELINDIKSLYHAPTEYNTQDIAQWIMPSTAADLQEVSALLEKSNSFTTDAINQQIKEWIKIKNIKTTAIAQPLRIALVGKSSGPGVFELMAVLGKHAVITRIHALIEYIKKM
jgi:glutamyl-tRNA synthetase